MPGSGFSVTMDHRGVRLELPPPNSYTLISIVTIRDNYNSAPFVGTSSFNDRTITTIYVM